MSRSRGRFSTNTNGTWPYARVKAVAGVQRVVDQMRVIPSGQHWKTNLQEVTREYRSTPFRIDLSAGRVRTGDVHPGLGRRRGPGGARAGVLGGGDPEDARASLRRPARGPRHRQQPPGRLPPGRGGGQRRPVRRGELAARVRPLPRRVGRSRVGLCARLPQAHRHHVPHALDRAGPAAAADDPEPGGPQPGHRGHDQSCRAAVGERLRRVGVRTCR